ncbi:MAG: phenylalanine--tRNA ligase subunit beta [Tepidisphaeraceae bacterium]
MKISLEWLSDFLVGPLDPGNCAEALTHGGLPVESIEPFGNDTVIDVEVTSNRGDCLSHLGVARELSALLPRELKRAEPTAGGSGAPVDSVTSVRIDNSELCPHYTARVIRGVKVRPSPAWIQRRLEAVGVRPINNIVDATNYVMFELGQPLHAFDFDKLGGRKIVVRTARPGEKLISIDGHERSLSRDMLVIADESKPVALAGVMGGRDSEVSDSTTSVLLESARFDPLSVRRTARRLAMKSDSSYRFERGIDPALPESASLRAAQLIVQMAGGELLSGVAQAGAAAGEPKRLILRLHRLREVLGIEIPLDDAVAALKRLGLSPRAGGAQIETTVPPHRLDLNIEVDLIEEVARVLGYDRIPVREEISIRLTSPQPDQRTTATIRQTLAAAGYFEAITVTFVSDALKDQFVPRQAASLPRAELRKSDAHLRVSMLPGLLEAVRGNETSGTSGARLFEIGSVFFNDSSGAIVEQRQLGIAGGNDLHELRGTVELVLTRLDATKPIAVVPSRHSGYDAQVCGRIEWGGKEIGQLGRVDGRVATMLDLRIRPVAAELQLEPLLSGAQHVPQLIPLPRFPAVRRDVSLILAESVRYQAVEQVVRSVGMENLDSAEYVTTYRGKPLEKGQKSVTVALVFRSASATLTSQQVEPAVQRFVDAAKQQLGATLRA